MNFSSKLSRVLKLFLHLKQPISDDTSLQRLLDLIQESCTKKIGSTDTEKPNDTGTIVVEFLQSVVDDIKCIEPSITTFALSVCGIVVTETAFYTTHEDLVELLYHSVNKHRLIDDPSVGTAYFKSLALICRNRTWTRVQHFIQEHVNEAYTTLIGNASLFRQSAARQFLVIIIVKQFTENQSMTEPNTFLATLTKMIVDNLIKHLLECIVQKVTTANKTLSSLLELWVDILMTCPKSSQLLMEDVDNVAEMLMKICLDGPKNLQNIAENLLIKLLDCCSPETGNMIMSTTVIPLFEDESLGGDFLAKHRMASNMLKTLQLSEESSSQLKAINHLPLQFLFGAATSCKSNLNIVGETVAKKSSLTKLLLQILDVAHLDPKNHETVVNLLACTDPNNNLNLLKCSHAVQRHLIGNTKLQLKLLSTIAKLADSDVMQHSCLCQAVDVTLIIIGQPQVDPKIYQVGQDCLLTLLSMMARHDSESPTQCMSKFTDLLEKRFVDTQWEVRDTALEGIKKLITQFKDNQTVLSKLAACRIVESAWRCYADSDSYVRASSFFLIAEVVKYPQIWSHFVTGKDCQEDNLVAIALNILNTDSEAFARRAAVDFIHSFYCERKRYLTDPAIRTVITGLCSAIADFDWEVKFKVLHFIKMIIDNTDIEKPSKDTIPEYAAELKQIENQTDSDKKKTISGHLMFLADLDCFSALCDGIHDFDNTVQEQAYTILGDIKLHISQSQDLCNILIKDDDKDMAAKNLLNLNDCSSENVLSPEAKLSKFLCVLRDIDFEDKFRELSSSVDEYVRNPVSLLDDILSAEFTQDTEENIVDCY